MRDRPVFTPKKILDDLAESFGGAFREGLERSGSIGLLFFEVFRRRWHWPLIFEQLMVVGLKSLPIVILVALFTGFIATWQVQYLAGDIVGLRYLGMVVGKVVFTDLGPTLMSLMLAGRIGAKLAAEVGTMRVTEQVDAMECLALDPITYVVGPRVIAGFVMVPVLFVFGSLTAIVSAQVLATVALGLPVATFYNSMRLLFSMNDVLTGLLKSFCFGGLTALCGCYFGFYTTGGAVGVGASTRKAVVASSILILFVNLIISQVMM
ncbi:MAG: ABC transporter permease [Chitinivibrionales bacterium]|nr:ABC transporter permease [Chitinivibrionales bacterium]MBD3358644.1 ABC transporter permease [Chitinivibrionales bacterium]